MHVKLIIPILVIPNNFNNQTPSKMKRLEIKSQVSYHWTADDGKEIIEEHIDLLKQDAFERIIEMRKQEYVEGELYSEIYIKDSDPEEHKRYSGWWKWNEEPQPPNFIPINQ